MGKPNRELTGGEKRRIRRLVVSKCANYGKEYGCPPSPDSRASEKTPENTPSNVTILPSESLVPQGFLGAISVKAGYLSFCPVPGIKMVTVRRN